MRMLPGGFKKDSRVWLHKNSTFQKKNPLSKRDCEGQRIGMDDPYECLTQDQYNCSEPLLTDANGRIYKKDSRTWLHKSSRKKIKSPRAGEPMEEIGNRLGYKQEVHGLRAGETQEGVVERTRSSAELLRLQPGANKIKKKKTMVLMSMIVTPPPSSGGAADTTPADTRRSFVGNAKYGSSPMRASYHDVSGACKGCTAVSAFASDLCIAGKDRSPSRITLQDHFADSDNDNNDIDNCNDDDDDNDDDEDDEEDVLEDDEKEDRNLRIKQQQQHQRVDARRSGGGGGGGVHRANWNHSTVEVTKDGLRELEKMMKEQSHRRSARLAKSLLDRQTPGCDVSPESLSSDSRVSLDANVNLSEEMMCGRELNQSHNSAEQQLTQATEFLHVCSPDRQTTKRPCPRCKSRPP